MTELTKAIVDQLIAEAMKQRTLYYKDGSNTMGDDEYDKLHDLIEDWLLENDPDHWFLEEVGYDDDDSSWEVKSHEYPMGSLAKCKTLEEFTVWHNKTKIIPTELLILIIQEKLDGISIALTYDDGKLTKALTRQTGTKGEDITRNVIKMKGIPKSIDYKGHIVLRGEILLYHDDFLAVNKVRIQNEEDYYKNPRNAAAGMAKDQKGRYCKFLTVQIYDIMNINDTGVDQEHLAIHFIESLGFIPVQYKVINTIEDANKVYEEYIESRRENLNWDIDGLVIKTNTWKDSGDDWKKPKNKIAWKFPPQRRQTKIIRIEASPASRITPVAVFEPVECGGVTIQRASLANWKLCLEKNIGPGAIVEISRRNDVIPYVESVLQAGETPELPKECPTCKAPVEWEMNSHGEESAYLVCSSLDCPNKLVKLIHKWLDIHETKGIGSAFVEKIVTEGMVTSLVDFLNFPFMTNWQNVLMNSDGYGKRKMNTINKEIERTCNTTVWKFFSGLNFNSIGSTRIQAIIDAMTEDVTVQNFIKFVFEDKLLSVESFGDGLRPIMINQLKKNLDLIDKLQSIVTITDAGKPKLLSSNLENKVFCFTGKMEHMKRSEAEKIVKAHGGKTGSVNKKLTVLVTNDQDSTSGKAKKARDLKIPMISEEEFMKMVGIEVDIPAVKKVEPVKDSNVVTDINAW